LHGYLSQAYHDPKLWGMVWEHVADGDNLPDIRSTCVLFALEMNADFHFRILRKVLSLPLTLLWMAYSPPEEECKKRLDLCKELLALLLSTDASVKETTPWKVAYVFEDLIRDAVRKRGKLDAQLHRLFALLGHALPADTQDIEGINSIIKHQLHSFPSIGLELLNSRVLAKKTSAREYKSGEMIEEEVQKCIADHESACLALHDRERYFLFEEETMHKQAELPVPLGDAIATPIADQGAGPTGAESEMPAGSAEPPAPAGDADQIPARQKRTSNVEKRSVEDTGVTQVEVSYLWGLT